MDLLRIQTAAGAAQTWQQDERKRKMALALMPLQDNASESSNPIAEFEEELRHISGLHELPRLLRQRGSTRHSPNISEEHNQSHRNSEDRGAFDQRCTQHQHRKSGRAAAGIRHASSSLIDMLDEQVEFNALDLPKKFQSSTQYLAIDDALDGHGLATQARHYNQRSARLGSPREESPGDKDNRSIRKRRRGKFATSNNGR